jgi:hypothetical protein
MACARTPHAYPNGALSETRSSDAVAMARLNYIKVWFVFSANQVRGQILNEEIGKSFRMEISMRRGHASSPAPRVAG